MKKITLPVLSVSFGLIAGGILPVIATSTAHAETIVVDDSHTTQCGRPEGYHGGTGYALQDSQKEKIIDDNIPVQYVDNPELKKGVTNIKSAGEKGYTLKTPTRIDKKLPLGETITATKAGATADTKYHIEITNIDMLLGFVMRVGGRAGNLKYECFKAFSSDNTIDLQTGTVTYDFSLEVQGSAYIRKGGPLDKGPIKIKITDPQGAVVLEKTLDDIYATEFTDEVVPAVPQIIERGTKIVPTTKWIDEADNHELKPEIEIDKPATADAIDGYEFVKTTTVDEITTHFYKRKPTPETHDLPTQPTTPAEPQQEHKLAATGEDNTIFFTIGALLIITSAGTTLLRRKK